GAVEDDTGVHDPRNPGPSGARLRGYRRRPERAHAQRIRPRAADRNPGRGGDRRPPNLCGAATDHRGQRPLLHRLGRRRRVLHPLLAPGRRAKI
ncbi:MAG: hypothetical protein AVDCRST_MAG78-2514, partial [uncultured Rubrobacteraceae bacterium]